MHATASGPVSLGSAGGPPGALLAHHRRSRLSTRLDEALRPAVRLTVVSAPPGYGKSVAVAGWIAERGLPVAWVTLDAACADPTHLANALLTALAAARPAATRLARAVGPGATPDPAALADVLHRALASDDGDLVLVLDDYQLADGGDARGLVAPLLERLPPFCHVVVVTREDPDLPLGRLRAHGSLAEVRADDLRFTRDEAAAFLADEGLSTGIGGGDPGAPPPVEDDLVALLLGTTEGWAAALRLAAIAMRASPDAGAAARAVSGTHRYVIDYLADEVMAGLDDALREALPCLAVVDRFTIELAAALAGREDCAALVERAERANLFLAPLDASRRWFRLHGLFADYLRTRLRPAERRRLHAIAAAWFESEGLGRDAVAHALEAGDAAEAARFVAREGRAVFEAGELRTLERWIAALPAEVRDADTALVALDAWARFYTGDLAGAAAIAARATAGPAPVVDGAAYGRLLVLLGLVGTTTRADAEATARSGLDLVGDDPLFRSLGLQAAGLAQLARGDIEGSLETLRGAFDAALVVGTPMAVLPAVNPLGHALVATGRRDEAEAVSRRVLDAYRSPSGEPLAVAWSARLALGIALYEGGDVVDARGELEGGLAAAEALGVGREVLGWALPSIALARQATGDGAGALAILVPRPGAMAFPSLAGETEARIRLAQGDLGRASRWADTARAEAPAGSPLLAMLRASADTTVARVRLAEGRAAEAGAAAASAMAAFERGGTVPDRVSSLVVAAAASLAAGERAAARASLASAVRLAAPGGYVRRLVDDGRTLAPLLRGVTDVAPAFVARVGAALAQEATGAGTVRRGTTVLVAPDGGLVESLTGRELDVLRHVATGATNAELARDLGVSAGTAKWHVAHVLAKLGARSRTQAVVRGQQLGLI